MKIFFFMLKKVVTREKYNTERGFELPAPLMVQLSSFCLVTLRSEGQSTNLKDAMKKSRKHL